MENIQTFLSRTHSSLLFLIGAWMACLIRGVLIGPVIQCSSPQGVWTRATSKLQKPDHGILMPIDAPNPKHLPNVFEQIMFMLTALKRYLCLRSRTASLLFEYCHFPCLRVERFKKITQKWKLDTMEKKERKSTNMQNPAVLGVAARSLQKP